MRPLVLSLTALLALPAGAAPLIHPGYSPSHGPVLTATWPICGTDVLACLLTCGIGGVGTACQLSWDTDVMGRAVPTPAELDGLALPMRKNKCLEGARIARVTAIDAALTPDEMVIVRTEPVAPEYQARRDYWDAVIVLHDAHAAPGGPILSATTAMDLTPCPTFSVPTFGEWEAAQ